MYALGAFDAISTCMHGAFYGILPNMERSGEAAKTTLTIRNVDGSTKELLRIRAAKNGRSMEAELRFILHEAVIGSEQRPNLAESIRQKFERFHLIDGLPEHPHIPPSDPIDFGQ